MSDEYDRIINRGNCEPEACQCAQPKNIHWVADWIDTQTKVLQHEEWHKQLAGDIINAKTK